MKRTYTGKSVENQARKYCSEDISLIEGYAEAKAANFVGFCIHHRLEYLPCQNRWVSKQELIEKGIYYGRPSWELVFMRIAEHQKFHRQDPNWKEATRNSEKHKAAARQNLKKATEAVRNSEKQKEAARQNLKKAIEASAKARRKPFIIDSIRFENQRDAANHFGVVQSTIFFWLNGKTKTDHVCRYI